MLLSLQCDARENCAMCHTRTEQQFHPEIYKSTKCNDMLQHGYCPRGPFCAFAHNDGAPRNAEACLCANAKFACYCRRVERAKSAHQTAITEASIKGHGWMPAGKTSLTAIG